ncbi:MAG: hypothetical protein ACTSO7_12020 [Candidatus Heimdallarchaeota archaeon]
MLNSKQVSILILLFLINTSIIFPLIPVESAAVEYTHLELAYYWAPIWYQDTHSSDYDADYITNFNFDNNWVGNDNWDNQPSYPLYAYIYYSFVETYSHIFIGYYDFHPRDWSFPTHENDLEGILIVIQKGDTPQGDFLLMETEAHNDLFQYTDSHSSPSNSVQNGGEDIDGDVQFEVVSSYDISLPFSSHNHPIVYVEDKGHGVYGAERWENSDFPNGDGVIYKPKGVAEEPSGGNDRNVGYELRSINDLWDRRFAFDDEKAFEEFGVFDGDDCDTDDAAKAPWGWDDNNDGSTFTGEFFYNPVDMINVHFSIYDYSFFYVYNPYAVIVRFDEYRVNDKSGLGSNVEAYFNLYMFDGEGRHTWSGFDDGVLDGDSGTQDSWKLEFELGEWIDMHAKIDRPFYGINYFNYPYFGIRSKQWKDILPDPWLMNIEETHWYDSSSADFNGEFVYFISSGENKHLDWGKSEVYLTLYVDYEYNIEWFSTDDDLPSQLPWWGIFLIAIGVIILIAFIISIAKGDFRFRIH